MKVVERIFEHKIRQQIDIDDTQLGFMKGKGTDGIFIVREMLKKFRAKGKKLYFGFVDLVMHKSGVEEWLVLAVMSIYTGAKTVIRTVYGNNRLMGLR